MVEKHGIFQGYYFFEYLGLDKNMRDQFAGHPYYDMTAEFCAEYDQPAFDPNYPTTPLEEFEPLLRRLLLDAGALDLQPRLTPPQRLHLRRLRSSPVCATPSGA